MTCLLALPCHYVNAAGRETVATAEFAASRKDEKYAGIDG